MNNIKLPTADRANVVLMPVFIAKPGCAQELEKALRVVQTASRLDAGCMAYRVFEDAENSDRFFLYEEWADSQALEAHLQLAHVVDFVAAVNPLMAEPFQVSTLRNIM